MATTSLALAAELCGAEESDGLLAELCAAAERVWEGRLAEGVSRENCGEAFSCAVAFTAAADYLGKNACGAEAFTVGDVTVRSIAGQVLSEQAEALRETADQLMRPYAPSGSFCFRGVRG